MSILHYPKLYFWAYERSAESGILSWIHFINNITVIVIIAICYTGIAIRLRIQIRRLGGQSSLSHRQKQVTIQAVLICSIILLGFLVWFILPAFLPNNKWAMYVCGWMWVINCGANPFIYLMFSSKIRREFQILCGKAALSTAIPNISSHTERPKTLRDMESKKSSEANSNAGFIKNQVIDGTIIV